MPRRNQHASASPRLLPTFESLEPREFLSSAHGYSKKTAHRPPLLKFTVTAVSMKTPQKCGKPDLQAASDNGFSSTDNVTSVTNPVFDIDKTDANVTVQLLRDGVVVGSIYSPYGGTVSVRDSATFVAGVHTYTARQVNAAGMAGAESAGLKVTLVTAAPPPPVAPGAPSTPDLQTGSDSGVSATDDLTAAPSLSFDITGVTSGNTVRLVRDGVVVATGIAGGSSITLVDSGTGSDGVYQYSAVQVSTAGVASSFSGSLTVTVDRTAPASAAVALDGSSDSGASSSDGVTNVSTPTLTLGGLESGATAELLRDGVSVGSVSGGTFTESTPLADGTYTYTLRQTDLAGNVSVSGGRSVTIDTSAPSTPSLTLLSDTGIAGDGLTRDRRPVFSVSGAEAGSLVELLDGDIVVGSVVASGGAVTIAPTSRLSVGVHNFSVRQTDVAGNTGSLSDPTSVRIINYVAASDFDGDGVSDIAVYSAGSFYINGSTLGPLTVAAFGGSTDVPATGDYDGDGITDLAVYRPGSRLFIIQPSTTPDVVRFQFIGTKFAIPVAADYDGDGITDVAVFAPGTATFTIMNSTGSTRTLVLGAPGDVVPLAGDVDGDGLADPAVYDRATGTWTLAKSTGGTLTHAFGNAAIDQPLLGDYDGDGFDDLAVFDASTAAFRVEQSSGGITTTSVGSFGSTPIAGDFDGDLKTDFATYRNGAFDILASTAGLESIPWSYGSGANQPLPLSPLVTRIGVLGS